MQLSHQDFLKRISRSARETRVPTSCLFEITPTCNLRCHFCYVALDPYAGPYLSTDQIFQVFDKLEQAGVLYLTLTGGEIFSRRDFEEIYRGAKARGFLITLYSNATMVTEKHAALLRELPPWSMEVSIYGADAGHYEGTTGIPGSFGRFERGMQRLLDAGIKPQLKCPVSTLTMDHVPAMIEWAKARDLSVKFDMALDSRHDGNSAPNVYRIEPRAAKAVRDLLYEIQTSQQRGPLKECAGTHDGSGPEELYKCDAGRTGLFIDALGNASHCVIDREPAFPVLGMDFDELWARMGDWVTQPLPKESPCSGCDLRAGCDNCPARARLATGSPYSRDQYMCDVTHVEYGRELGIVRQRPARPVGTCAA